MLTFNVPTKPEKYFHQLMEILKVFAPFNELRKRERDVFGTILYQLHLLEQAKDPEAEVSLFDYKVKEEIASSVGISKANLYNIYKELRQHDILIKDGINPKYRFRYMQYPQITFKFRKNSSNGEK